MFIKILLVAVVLLVILAIVISLRPSSFRYERSIAIAAPASAIFPLINNQQEWLNWSPWAKLDPNIKNTFEGPDSGVGSVYAWEGNKDVGAGRSTIVESKTDELVRMKLEFYKPFKATHTADLSLKAEGEKTVVTWSMYGSLPFVGKAMGLVMDCDKMCGGMFEKGLATLKENAEKRNAEMLK